jgi:phenylacetate-CoA ligase
MTFTHSETSTRETIRQRQEERLAALLAEVANRNPFWQERFARHGVEVGRVRSLDDLASLPLLEKQELVEDQNAHPPYGTNLTYPLTAYSRLHQTSGTTGTPMRWLDTPQSWDWFMECWTQIYRIVGITPEDVFAFPFSFGPFIGFWAAFDGAQRLGNLSLAMGGMSSEARLKMMLDLQATIVCCTPTYALRLADVAADLGLDLAGSPVRMLIVAGEPGGSIPAIRERIESAWGARLIDHWGMTDLGSLGVEPLDRPGGLLLLETECIAEILDPESHEPVPPGEMGELVVTNLGRWGQPVIRYRTGDLVRAGRRQPPDDWGGVNGQRGRGEEGKRGGTESTHQSQMTNPQSPMTNPSEENLSLKNFSPTPPFTYLEGGILGRADDMVTIRGNNVFPSSLDAILREFPDVVEYRITVTTRRAMPHLKIEVEPGPATGRHHQRSATLVGKIEKTIKDRMNFHAEIALVPEGALPRFELKGRRFVRE